MQAYILFSITIRFLQGRYHATPWNRHVSDGVVEWPPAPWRILRAIIATWKNTRPDLKDDTMWPILQKLASEPPSYSLPDASVSHTQNSLYANQKRTSLISDTFVTVGRKPVYVVWNNVTLNPEESNRLNDILTNIRYLGRAKSRCHMSISQTYPMCNCMPLNDENVPGEQKTIRVLVPNSHVRFEDLESQVEGQENLKSITVTTRTLQDHNHTDPPGGKWLLYAHIKPQNCFEAKKDTTDGNHTLDNVTLVRYAVIGRAKPDVRDTLRVGDTTRTACMSRYGRANDGESSTIFSGKDGQGNPLTDHIHAFFLPTCEVQERKIDHITIVAKNGFGRGELDALLGLKRLYRYNTDQVNLSFLECGQLRDFRDVPILGTGRTWISVTPLVLTRHVKYRGQGSKKHVVDGIEEQIRREITERYGPTHHLERVAVLDRQRGIGNTDIKPSEFFRWRSHGSKGSDRAYNIRLEFRESVCGPLTLGYASHFGLGMFVPEEKSSV